MQVPYCNDAFSLVEVAGRRAGEPDRHGLARAVGEVEQEHSAFGVHPGRILVRHPGHLHTPTALRGFGKSHIRGERASERPRREHGDSRDYEHDEDESLLHYLRPSSLLRAVSIFTKYPKSAIHVTTATDAAVKRADVSVMSHTVNPLTIGKCRDKAPCAQTS